ncbi:MAG: c-type cytochrome biogenesis protein CcsB, partial [Nocardioides sp.]
MTDFLSDGAWEALSNQAVAAAGIVYFLAMMAHLVEVSAGGKVAGPVAVARTTEGSVVVDTDDDRGDVVRREALFGRLGVLLTVIAVGIHLVSLVARGLAADPDRVPWGNMYEFTLAGTFVVAALYLVLLRRYALAWMGPIVTGVVLTLLMVAVIWLYAPIAPLTEALYSPWLVIHVVSAIIATGAFTLGGI